MTYRQKRVFVSSVAARPVDLRSPTSHKTAFIALEAGEYLLGDYPGGECLKIVMCHIHISKADR